MLPLVLMRLALPAPVMAKVPPDAPRCQLLTVKLPVPLIAPPSWVKLATLMALFSVSVPAVSLIKPLGVLSVAPAFKICVPPPNSKVPPLVLNAPIEVPPLVKLPAPLNALSVPLLLSTAANDCALGKLMLSTPLAPRITEPNVPPMLSAFQLITPPGSAISVPPLRVLVPPLKIFITPVPFTSTVPEIVPPLQS